MNTRAYCLGVVLALSAVTGFAMYSRHLDMSPKDQSLAQLKSLEYDGDWVELFGAGVRVKLANCRHQLGTLRETADPADPDLACAEQNIQEGIRRLQEGDYIAIGAQSDERLQADKAACTTILRLNRIAEAHADLAQVYIDRYSQVSK